MLVLRTSAHGGDYAGFGLIVLANRVPGLHEVSARDAKTWFCGLTAGDLVENT